MYKKIELMDNVSIEISINLIYTQRKSLNKHAQAKWQKHFMYNLRQ